MCCPLRGLLGREETMPFSHYTGRRKVVVVGAGAVGSTFCYALCQRGLADEIALIDTNTALAHGQVLDLVHGKPFLPTVDVRVGDCADYADAQLIVVTAGAAQQPGQNRLQLAARNAAIMHRIVDDIVAQHSDAVMLVVSNPVDVLTQVAIRRSGWEAGRVIGSGTVLDSARLRYLLSSHCGIDVHNVHAYMLGEHGDSELAAWSMTHLAGVHIDRYCPMCGACADWRAELDRIEQQVRDSAYHVIDYKGATWFAVGLALVQIAAAVLRGQRSVMTVSTLLRDAFGVSEVCLSVPSIVSAAGVERIVAVPLQPAEQTALAAGARQVKAVFDAL